MTSNINDTSVLKTTVTEEVFLWLDIGETIFTNYSKLDRTFATHGYLSSTCV